MVSTSALKHSVAEAFCKTLTAPTNKLCFETALAGSVAALVLETTASKVVVEVVVVALPEVEAVQEDMEEEVDTAVVDTRAEDIMAAVGVGVVAMAALITVGAEVAQTGGAAVRPTPQPGPATLG
uniref:(California timema) hypothetical protein n=1 Tax=Timema californicum TaxID=61474 RepID=A0A7R9JEZ2_TIMCA|nr:unnamed protein product [Timema californicum]